MQPRLTGTTAARAREAVVIALAGLACEVTPAGLGAAADPAPAADAGADAPRVLPRRDAAPGSVDAPPLPSVAGDPFSIGCADGTREGFAAALDVWPRIAGCAGAWEVPGLIKPAVTRPSCNLSAGNSGINPAGAKCSAADLCALGWHVCEGPQEVARLSPSDCESIVPPGVVAFFAVAGGATPEGTCTPGRPAVNDLHGCGSGDIGQPEVEGCFPLDRRMAFHDCALSGVWFCGRDDQHLQEAALATKPAPALGGVLCCR
jgi:hypothetical protein